MAVTVTEKPESRVRTNKSERRIYLVLGTADQDEALVSLTAAVPAVVGGYVRKDRSVKPVFVDTANPDKGIWEGEVLYVSPSYSQAAEPPATGDSSYTFTVGESMQHITQSLSTTSYAPPGKTAPDFNGAIGATADGVAGTDIPLSDYRFSETHYLADGDVDAAYKTTLYNIKNAPLNNAAFRGIPARACRFLGASGSKRGGGSDWEITFNFAAAPNETGLTIGTITGIAKGGFDLLDVHYETAEDESACMLVQRPVSVDVHKVLKESDFAGLKIGTN